MLFIRIFLFFIPKRKNLNNKMNNKNNKIYSKKEKKRNWHPSKVNNSKSKPSKFILNKMRWLYILLYCFLCCISQAFSYAFPFFYIFTLYVHETSSWSFSSLVDGCCYFEGEKLLFTFHFFILLLCISLIEHQFL